MTREPLPPRQTLALLLTSKVLLVGLMVVDVNGVSCGSPVPASVCGILGT